MQYIHIEEITIEAPLPHIEVEHLELWLDQIDIEAPLPLFEVEHLEFSLDQITITSEENQDV